MHHVDTKYLFTIMLKTHKLTDGNVLVLLHRLKLYHYPSVPWSRSFPRSRNWRKMKFAGFAARHKVMYSLNQGQWSRGENT